MRLPAPLLSLQSAKLSPSHTAIRSRMLSCSGQAYHGEGGRPSTSLGLNDLSACVLDALHHLGQLCLLKLDRWLRLHAQGGLGSMRLEVGPGSFCWQL